MTLKETLEIIKKQWVNANDIRKVTLCNRNKSFDIKKMIKINF